MKAIGMQKDRPKDDERPRINDGARHVPAARAPFFRCDEARRMLRA
jgi:hypothetical protein